MGMLCAIYDSFLVVKTCWYRRAVMPLRSIPVRYDVVDLKSRGSINPLFLRYAPFWFLCFF